MELDFLRQMVIFIKEVYDKISNRLNIPELNEDNRQLLARLWMQRNEGVMENVIVLVLNAWDLRGEEYLSQQPQNIAGNMDMLRGGTNIVHL